MSWIYLLPLAALVQMADVASTVIGLRRGLVERNPLIAAVMQVAGPWGWPALKLAGAGAAYWLLWRSDAVWVAAGVTAIMIGVVARNVWLLGR